MLSEADVGLCALERLPFLRFPATFHNFGMLTGLADTPATKSAIQLAAQKLGESLSAQKRAESPLTAVTAAANLTVSRPGVRLVEQSKLVRSADEGQA